MIFFSMKNITIILLFVLTFCVNVAQSAIIEKIKIENNNRISKETIITYGDIKLNQDYDSKRVNETIKNLYETNFFEDLKISIEGNTLIIDVVENKIIQNVIVEGIKSKTMTKQILENIFSKDKAPFLISKVKLDSKKIKTSLDMMGYYFSKVESITKKNPNDTIDLIFNIDLGEKAKISKIEFIGDKKVKSRTLRNIIISEENKFWKFISRNKYLNKSVLETDKRLLKKFYLNKGYYDVKIESSTVDYFDNSTFKLTFKIDAGKKYFINKASLVLPIDYSQDNFANVNKILKKLNNKPYSFNKVSKVVEEIDKVSLSREYDFINAEIIENKVDDNKLNIIFKVKESDKFYIERINIVGNNITQENVIRNSLEVDEGDPFNELLNAKSINNIRSLRIFKIGRASCRERV